MFPINEFKIQKISEQGSEGNYKVSPLPKGYAHTLGNVFRRILLSSIPGAAVTSIKMKGIQHEYTTVAGLQNDVLEIVLSLKGVRVISRSDDPVTLSLKVKGKKGVPTTVTAADIEQNALIEIVNPDYLITTLADEKAEIDAEITIEKGIGYAPPSEVVREEVGAIPVDAIFSPVKLVAIESKNTRVGQQTDLDALEIKVVTDGTVTPAAAVYQAAEILSTMSSHLAISAKDLMSEKAANQINNSDLPISVAQPETVSTLQPVLLEQMNLSTRLNNALVNSGYTDLRMLEGLTEEEVKNIKGMGDKSFTELMDTLAQNGIKLI